MRFGASQQPDDTKYRGRPYAEVVADLEAKNPGSRINAVPDDHMVTMDFKMGRIRVRFNAVTGLVSKVTYG
jgi:putative heme iron utilization protein